MSSEMSKATDNASAATILVVDDEPYMRTIISRWLTEAGYRCAQAENADAAWKHLQQHDIHIVTLDISMPGRSGADLLPQIKQHYPDTEVIMLTALGEANLAISMLTHGAYGYLIKPVEPEELVFQAKKALERRQLVIEKRQYTRDLENKVREQTATIRRAHEDTILRLVSASRYRDEENGAQVGQVAGRAA